MAENRWYDDACGTALALELVGERWSLLIVRELMFGGRRFGEIKNALSGISANVLTQRLEGMEAAGILRKRKLPPPASVQIYELTPWGYESWKAIAELGRWAVRSPAHDMTLNLTPASLMMSFRTMFDADRTGDWAANIGFRFGDEHFLARIADGALTISRDDPVDADVVVSATTHGLAGLIYGGVPIADAATLGVTIAGDAAVLERFVTIFPLPAKLDEEPA